MFPEQRPSQHLLTLLEQSPILATIPPDPKGTARDQHSSEHRACPIEQDMTIKIFALCRTYYHIVQTLALCQMFQEQGAHPDLTIFRGKSILDHYPIKDHALDFSSLSFPSRMVTMPHSRAWMLPLAIIRLVLASWRVQSPSIALISPNGPHLGLLSALANSGHQPQAFYSIEEGLGTHGGMLHRSRVRANHSRHPMRLPLYLSGELLKRALLNSTTIRSGGITETIAARKGSTRGIRIPLAPYVKLTLASGIFRYSSQPFPENTALFLSQPYVEVGVMPRESYLVVLDSVREHFSGLGHNLLIKPHPAEDIYKLRNYQLCHFEGPVEALFGAHQKNLVTVAGINSTALVLAKSLFGLKAYRIEHSLLDAVHINELDEGFARLLVQSTEPLRLG